MNNMKSMDSIRTDIASLRQEMRDGFADLRQAILGVDAKLSVELQRVQADLMKWSFVFWCGAVAAIAALAGVLRH